LRELALFPAEGSTSTIVEMRDEEVARGLLSLRNDPRPLPGTMFFAVLSPSLRAKRSNPAPRRKACYFNQASEAEIWAMVTVQHNESADMARSIKLIFRSRDVHKIRNFAEDLSRSLGELGVLPMHEADAATDSVTVTKIHANQLRRCRVFVDRLLEKHFLIKDCDVVEQNGRSEWSEW
jgi:hypothetical protein